MRVLKPNQLQHRAPSVQTVSFVSRLTEAEKDVLNAVFDFHSRLRALDRTDVTFFDGEEMLVYARGWPRSPVPGGEGRVLGVLMWSAQEDGSWWTELGYVEPQYRREGIYTLLWEATVYEAQQANVRRIQGGTRHDNVEMQAAMQRLGRVPHSVVYDFEVPNA